MYALRTLDVWDTLLRRHCHPDLTKLAAARHLLLGYHGQLEAPYLDHWAIYQERLRIESALAEQARGAGSDGEYSLLEVLGCLVERLLGQHVPDRAAVAARLAQAELEIEVACTYVDPGCRAFIAQYPAARTLFLSDFYMPAAMLGRLLERHGMQDLAAAGLCSCDVRLSKRSGRLYRYVQEREGVSPAEHLHIGDNLHADVEVPARLGIRAIHYRPDVEEHKRSLHAQRFADRGALFRAIERQALDVAERRLAGAQDATAMTLRLGVRAAPLFVGFCLFIAERSLMDGVSRLYFFTREGEFFCELFQLLFPDGHFAGHRLPEARVLGVSRIATFCPSLQAVSIAEMMRLWSLYDCQSLFALAKSLGLAPEVLAEPAARHGLRLDEAIVRPWQDRRVQALFADHGWQQLLATKIHADRAAALAYFAAEGLTDAPEDVGVVDIGWRGTIQDNLALMLPAKTFVGYYLGLQRFLNPQPRNSIKHAYGPDANRDMELSYLLDAVSPMEMLCNSPHGSVMGYGRDAAGRPTLERLVEPAENAVYAATVEHFQQGVRLACRQWRDPAAHQVISSDELRERCCRIWSELIVRPERQISQAYTALSHNEVFGVGCFVDKRVVPSPLQMARSLVSARDRRELILYIKQTQWTSVVRHRDDLTSWHKALLMAALVVGRAYKRLRLWAYYVRAR